MYEGKWKHCVIGAGFVLGVGLGLWASRLADWSAMTGSAFVSGFQSGRQAARYEPDAEDNVLQAGYGENQRAECRETAEAVPEQEQRSETGGQARSGSEEEAAFQTLLHYNAQQAYGETDAAAPLRSDGV